MQNLQNFFDGLFLEKEITYPRLVNFAQNNVNNMELNNPGHIYDDAITNTSAAAANLDSLISGKISDKGIRKGGTEAKNQARINAEVYIANNIGYCRSKFGGKNDPRFIATFPQLMKAFYPVSDQVFEENLTALIKMVHNYVAILGVDLETDLVNLKNALTASTETHETQTSTVTTDIVTVQMAASVLSDQLTDNVLLIARNNRGSQTAATLYFNTNLLYPVKQKEYYERTIPPSSEIDVCDIDYDPDKIVEFENKGAVRLILGVKLAGDKVGQTLILMPGEKAAKTYSYFFSNGTSFYVKNEETTKGIFHLEIKSPQ